MHIQIDICTRLELFAQRQPPDKILSQKAYDRAQKGQECISCYACRKQCPYDLDIPALIKSAYPKYMKIWDEYYATHEKPF